MTENTHFEAFVDHIISDDDSDLGKMKAERDYALHCLEREIAICAQTQARNDVLVKALKKVEPFLSYGDNTEGRLKQIIKDALASIKES